MNSCNNPILGYADGGEVRQRRRQDPQGRYQSRVKTPSWVLDLIPIVGDAKGAYEIYQETQKPNPNWLLIGALGGAAVIGLIPGVGDAAAGLIKQGAKRALRRTKPAIDEVEDYLPAPFKHPEEDPLDTAERFGVSNLAERAIASGMDNPFTNAKITNTGINRAFADDGGWDFSGIGRDATRTQTEAVVKDIEKYKYLTDAEKESVMSSGVRSVAEAESLVDELLAARAKPGKTPFAQGGQVGLLSKPKKMSKGGKVGLLC